MCPHKFIGAAEVSIRSGLLLSVSESLDPLGEAPVKEPRSSCVLFAIFYALVVVCVVISPCPSICPNVLTSFTNLLQLLATVF